MASKAYLQSNGTPQTIADLHDHNCIGFRLLGSGIVYDWELSDRGKFIELKTSGTTIVTDATCARWLALASPIFSSPSFAAIFKGVISIGFFGKALSEKKGCSCTIQKWASLAPKLRAFIDAAKASLARAA